MPTRPPARNASPPGRRLPTRPAASSTGRKRRSVLWRWRRSLFVAGLSTVAVTGGAASVIFSIELPPEDPLRQTSFVCTAEVTDCGPDSAIATFSAEEDRINVPLEDVPIVLIDAVLATEDRDFFNHGGVDPVGIGRALYNDVRGRGVRQGGSTITQQYVKNVYLTSERSITRKIKEAVLAVKLERELDKQEILGRYLNTIYFGRGAYGVGAASRAYFGKDVRQIGIPEAAYLAGLIRAPEAADAGAYPEEASRRRDLSLRAMEQEGMITAEERSVAEAVSWDALVIPRRDRSKLDLDSDLEAVGGAYFLETVRAQIEEKYGAAVLYGGGLRIYVTLDRDMQEAAWNAVTETLNEPDDPAAALVAVDDQGRVKAMVGGRDYTVQKVNYALGVAGGGSGRGPGSSFKPFVLATAIRQGISLNSKFSAPAEITLPKADNGKDWVVGNYEDSEQGTLDLVDATRVSSNTAYAQLMLNPRVGPERVAELAHDLGVSAELDQVNSLVLGSEDVSPLDMAVGFSTFANRGLRNDPDLIQRIEQVHDGGGVSVLEQARPTQDRVLSEGEADQVTYALREVVTKGTGKAANFGKAAAGKTGTTNENRDAWFVGYTPTLTAAVWMGYPNDDPAQPPRLMKDVHGIEVTGGSLPAKIWNKFMRNATDGMDTGSFVTPKAFPGDVLNERLELTPDSTTSTSVDPDTSTTSVEPDAPSTSTSSTTTIALPTTTTSSTLPCPPGQVGRPPDCFTVPTSPQNPNP